MFFKLFHNISLKLFFCNNKTIHGHVQIGIVPPIILQGGLRIEKGGGEFGVGETIAPVTSPQSFTSSFLYDLDSILPPIPPNVQVYTPMHKFSKYHNIIFGKDAHEAMHF